MRISHPLLAPFLLLAPYLLYAIRGGLPRHLVSYLLVLFPLVAAASYLLHHPRMRVALQTREKLLLSLGLLAFFLITWLTGWSASPAASVPEIYNFYSELHDTRNGGFFQHPTENRTEFAIHWSPVLFLLVPVFHVFPVPATLYAFSAGLLTLSVLVARRFLAVRWPRESATLLALGAALFPSLLTMAIDFTPVRFAPIAIWALLVAYREDNTRLGVLAILACWCVKETTLLAVMMLGIVAVIQGRRAFWVFVPFLVGGGLFFITNHWLLPAFAGTAGKTSTVAAQFGYWGQNVPEVLIGFLQDPGSVVASLARVNNAAYLFKLGHGVLWILPLASPLTLMALPELMVNMMAGYNPPLLDPSRFGPWTSLLGHYSATIGIVLWAAAAEAWAPRKDEGQNEDDHEAAAWRRARWLFLAVLSTLIYPTNAESL